MVRVSGERECFLPRGGETDILCLGEAAALLLLLLLGASGEGERRSGDIMAAADDFLCFLGEGFTIGGGGLSENWRGGDIW